MQDVCIDGTPQGYGVYEVDGNQVKWYYKSAGPPKDYQFRSYAAGTSKEFPKDIIANVWNWDKNWKVEWLENGKVMGTMTQYTRSRPVCASSMYRQKENHAELDISSKYRTYVPCHSP